MSGGDLAQTRAGAALWSYALLLFAGGLWGVTFSLAKLATESGAHPLGINFWQALFGSLMLLAFIAIRRSGLPLDRTHLAFYLICGLLGTVIPGALLFYAARHLPAGVLSITIATVPIMTYLLAFVVRLDRLTPARMLGVVLGILGVILIATPESSLPDPATAPWVVAAVIAAACYAAENLFIAARKPADSGAVTVLCGMLLMGTLVMAPVVVATGSFVALPWSPFDWGQVELSILGMAAINVISYGLFVYLVTRSGPVFASQTAYVVTLSGVFWGIALFAEQHSLWIWAALLLMMAGLTLVKPRETS